MEKRKVSFNAKAFEESMKKKKCRKKLIGALIYLESAIKKDGLTRELSISMAFLKEKLKKFKQVKLAAA